MEEHEHTFKDTSSVSAEVCTLYRFADLSFAGRSCPRHAQVPLTSIDHRTATGYPYVGISFKSEESGGYGRTRSDTVGHGIPTELIYMCLQ